MLLYIGDNPGIYLVVLDIPGLLRPGTCSAIYRGQSWDILSSPGHPRTMTHSAIYRYMWDNPGIFLVVLDRHVQS